MSRVTWGLRLKFDQAFCPNFVSYMQFWLPLAYLWVREVCDGHSQGVKHCHGSGARECQRYSLERGTMTIWEHAPIIYVSSHGQ